MYLLPAPKQIEYKDGTCLLPYYGKIVIRMSGKSDLDFSANILKEEMKKQTGFDYMIARGNVVRGIIFLSCSQELEEDTYTLKIEKEKIEITGGTASAVLYGVQTLRQMLVQEKASLPCLEIKDYPNRKHRGYYHDVTRGRIPTLDFLKELADKMSYYKMNELQLYIEHSFLFEDFNEVWRDDTPLTPDEIIELDAYCRERNVELVPSMATFGHLYKLLSTKTYAHLCELPDSDKSTFSFPGRMAHHTINIAVDESFEMIKKMILEYMPLFTSNKFNICGDETFDLGKGRSKELADEIGVKDMYMNFVGKLCSFLVSEGKIPMFWGDIVCGFPEEIKKLPPETICLNWGYAPDQKEDATKLLSETGANQYVCPGVGGWNQFINLLKSSYLNISKMCQYGEKYHVVGILNTDWGDFGHINHPEFSMAGMIYGATFSWDSKDIPFEEINQQISALEYTDQSEQFLSVIAVAAYKSVFQWYHVVRYMEMCRDGESEEESRKYFEEECDGVAHAEECNKELEEAKKRLIKCLKTMDTSKASVVKPYLCAMDGMEIFNQIGAAIGNKKCGQQNPGIEEPKEIAAKLECWFREYKEIWRTVSKESELYRIQDVVFWYADLLRSL